MFTQHGARCCDLARFFGTSNPEISSAEAHSHPELWVNSTQALCHCHSTQRVRRCVDRRAADWAINYFILHLYARASARDAGKDFRASNPPGISWRTMARVHLWPSRRTVSADRPRRARLGLVQARSLGFPARRRSHETRDPIAGPGFDRLV